MAEIAFDTLKYARRLKECGVPESQAEVQAELMGEAFGYYIGNLVTKDYLEATLDARFTKQDERISRQIARLEQQNQEMSTRLATGFNNQELRFAAIDKHFVEQEFDLVARMDRGFAEIQSHLRLHSWILAALAVAILIPRARELAGLL